LVISTLVFNPSTKTQERKKGTKKKEKKRKKNESLHNYIHSSSIPYPKVSWLVSSLNNPQNSETMFCEKNMELKC